MKILLDLLASALAPKSAANPEPQPVMGPPVPPPLSKPEEVKPAGKVKHENNGKCLKCQEIMNRYPGFSPTLREWFEKLQAANPDAHTSCAGRGKADQEAALKGGFSKASYGKSSHNWNAALDIFQLTSDGKAAWPKAWFQKVVAPALTSELNWYGAPGSSFYELPHVEILVWRALRDAKALKLVE